MRGIAIRYLVFIYLVFHGVAFSQSQTLPIGWSMVGNDTGAAIDVSSIFGNTTTPNAISASVTSVWAWNNGLNRWSFFAPSLTPQEQSNYATSNGYGVLSSIARGEGFWVNARSQFVYNPSITANVSPVANAGVSQIVGLGSTVTLDGSASNDTNSDPLTYAWTLTSKPTGSLAVLASATSAKSTFTADMAGTYIASLVVYDGKTNSVSANVTISAKAPVAFVPTISVGGLHACGLQLTGGIQCWGWNVDGLLGDGTNITSAKPVQVSGINNAISVSASQNHTCALLYSGSIQCWGLNPFGGLGNDSEVRSYSPVTVSGIGNASSVAAGLWHSCAVIGNGSVQCWGGGFDGQLGNGSTQNSKVPVAVIGIGNALAVAAGQWHTCALLSDGAVKCWGKWFTGIKSNNQTIYSTPVAIEGVSGATSISLGNTHACALLSTGAVRCWGDNDFGQLGIAPLAPYNSVIPVTAAGITSAKALTAGDGATCVLLSTGLIQCWGRGAVTGFGSNGGLIDGGNSYLPVTINNIKNPKSLAISQSSQGYICATLNDNSVTCWRSGLWMNANLN